MDSNRGTGTRAAAFSPSAPSPELSGAYVLVPHPDTTTLCNRLKSHHLIADARLGHIRFAPDILTTREELTRAAAIIASALASGATA